MGNRRVKVVNYSPGNFSSIADVISMRIIAWANQYFVDWLPNKPMPAFPVEQNKIEFDSFVDCLTEDLGKIVLDNINPTQFMNLVAQKKEFYRLIQTITENPEDSLAKYSNEYKFLEKFSFVDSGKVSRLVELKKELDNVIDELTGNLSIIASGELSPEQMLEKIGFIQEEKNTSFSRA